MIEPEKVVRCKCRALLRKMKTVGWETRVWFNGRWYYGLKHTCGLRLDVYGGGSGKKVTYWCSTSLAKWDSGEGYGYRYYATLLADPNKAVERTLRDISAYAKEIAAHTQSIESALGKKKGKQ